MYKQVLLPLAFVATSFAPLSAHADEYLYSQNDRSTATRFNFAFTYLSPDLITTATTFTPDTYELTSNGVLITPASFTVTINPNAYPDGGSINVLASPYFSSYTSTLPPSFFTVGEHSIFFIPVPYTLDITDIPATTATTVTPEPSTLALLGTGVFGVFGTLRRRVFSASDYAGVSSRLER